MANAINIMSKVLANLMNNLENIQQNNTGLFASFGDRTICRTDDILSLPQDRKILIGNTFFAVAAIYELTQIFLLHNNLYNLYTTNI